VGTTGSSKHAAGREGGGGRRTSWARQAAAGDGGAEQRLYWLRTLMGDALSDGDSALSGGGEGDEGDVVAG